MNKKQSIRSIGEKQGVFAKLEQWFLKEKNDIFFCITVTFVLGMLAHAFAFFNTNFSHDELNAAYANTTELKWKIELGRFLVPFYQLLFRGRWTVPWLIGILALVYVGVAVYLMKKFFEVDSKLATLLIAGVAVTNLTVISQISTYIHELDCNMLALVFSVSAAYVWKKHCNLKGLIIVVILLFLSTGIYQSYITVAITLILSDSIFKLLNNENAKKVMLQIVAGLGCVILAFAMYLICNKLACLIVNVSPQERTEVFLDKNIPDMLVFYLKLSAKAYIRFLRLVVDRYVYGGIIMVIATGIAVVLILIATTLIKGKGIKVINKILTGILVALLPLCMNAIFVIARGMCHHIMVYGVWLMYILFVVLVCKFGDHIFKKVKLNQLVKCLSYLLIFILIWQNITISNTLYLKKDTEAKSTLSTMTRVVAAMEDCDGYEMGITPVAFVGVDHPYGKLDGFKQIEYITGAEENNSIQSDVYVYYYNAYKAYFNYVLNYPIEMCSDEKQAELKGSDFVKKMPCFPEEGSIVIEDGIMIVKMS